MLCSRLNSSFFLCVCVVGLYSGCVVGPLALEIDVLCIPKKLQTNEHFASLWLTELFSTAPFSKWICTSHSINGFCNYKSVHLERSECVWAKSETVALTQTHQGYGEAGRTDSAWELFWTGSDPLRLWSGGGRVASALLTHTAVHRHVFCFASDPAIRYYPQIAPRS